MSSAAAAANKRVHQCDDLFIIFINNIHYEGATWIDMPATIIIVLKNTKRTFPTSSFTLYLLSAFISQQTVRI